METMEFQITDLAGRSPEEKTRKRIAMLEGLIAAQSLNAQRSDRYLRMYASCLSEERLRMIRRHKERLCEAVAGMYLELDGLKHMLHTCTCQR